MRLIAALATVTIFLAGCGGKGDLEEEGRSGAEAEAGGEQEDDEDDSGDEPEEE